MCKLWVYLGTWEISDLITMTNEEKNKETAKTDSKNKPAPKPELPKRRAIDRIPEPFNLREDIFKKYK